MAYILDAGLGQRVFAGPNALSLAKKSGVNNAGAGGHFTIENTKTGMKQMYTTGGGSATKRGAPIKAKNPAVSAKSVLKAGKSILARVKRVGNKLVIQPVERAVRKARKAVKRTTRRNPGTIPGLKDWNQFGGGTSVPDKYHGYDYRTSTQTYTISPIGNHGRFAYYILRTYPGRPARGHQDLAKARRASELVKVARDFEKGEL